MAMELPKEFILCAERIEFGMQGEARLDWLWRGSHYDT